MAQEELETSFSDATRSPSSDSNHGAAAGRAQEEDEEVDDDFRGDGIERGGLRVRASSGALLSGAAEGRSTVASRREQGGRMGEDAGVDTRAQEREKEESSDWIKQK